MKKRVLFVCIHNSGRSLADLADKEDIDKSVPIYRDEPYSG